MFNCSSEVKWIRVTDIDSGLAWINLENVERIYAISEGSAFECIDSITRTTVPFEKIPDLLGGGSQ
ncbi:hypothetical protein S101174_01002 [Levilactobacillus brevis]|nr:hypothetical protein S101174_01002 [Levilactobacillus brevis]